jgi:hypothetical protein
MERHPSECLENKGEDEINNKKACDALTHSKILHIIPPSIEELLHNDWRLIAQSRPSVDLRENFGSREKREIFYPERNSIHLISYQHAPRFMFAPSSTNDINCSVFIELRCVIVGIIFMRRVNIILKHKYLIKISKTRRFLIIIMMILQ